MRLSALFDLLTPDERNALAARAGLNSTYLWQIAKRWEGKRPSLGAIKRLAAADSRLTVIEMVEEFEESPQAVRARRASEELTNA